MVEGLGEFFTVDGGKSKGGIHMVKKGVYIDVYKKNRFILPEFWSVLEKDRL